MAFVITLSRKHNTRSSYLPLKFGLATVAFYGLSLKEKAARAQETLVFLEQYILGPFLNPIILLRETAGSAFKCGFKRLGPLLLSLRAMPSPSKPASKEETLFIRN
jgi:hypothetical protein